jgi:hypothetical protein
VLGPEVPAPVTIDPRQFTLAANAASLKNPNMKIR